MDFNKIFRPKIALPMITAVALILRLIPIRFRYLLGYDPYFHLAYIEEALKAGKWLNFFTIANGPWGFQMRTFHPLGLWATPAYVYKLLKIFGLSLYNAFRITPVIFGILTIAVFYWALLKLYDEKRAFFASLFLAVSFGHVFRSMAGYYRGDNYMLFWYSISLLGIAYAFSTRERLGHKSLAFYAVPALASGLAAAFWQAYYPIFVFLLASAVFLGVGDFLLGRDRYILDGILLTVSTAIGALIANYLGARVGYGMLGYDRWLSKTVAEKLSLELTTVRDAYLLFHLKYLVPLALAGLLALLALSKFIRDKRLRTLTVLVFGALAVYLLFARFEGLKDLSTGFGIFNEWPISETRPSTFHDLWSAFAVGLFLAPSFPPVQARESQSSGLHAPRACPSQPLHDQDLDEVSIHRFYGSCLNGRNRVVGAL